MRPMDIVLPKKKLIMDLNYLFLLLLMVNVTDLETEKGIQLLFMKRDNAKNPHPKWLRQYIFKLRRRIEPLFHN